MTLLSCSSFGGDRVAASLSDQKEILWLKVASLARDDVLEVINPPGCSLSWFLYSDACPFALIYRNVR